MDCDVLVIGAGGAGLRAAIEASAAGVKVGLICKSLLGKAHTVMAEGGMAAAMGNVDDRDGWKVHFADTMRGACRAESVGESNLSNVVHGALQPVRDPVRSTRRPLCSAFRSFEPRAPANAAVAARGIVNRVENP